MKILFEGTAEQIKNLKLLIEHKNNNLPTLREDYQIENLWCIKDVTLKFNCTNEEALEVLKQALTNDATMQQIWYAIDFHGEDNELARI